ncbi:AAA family ATPase [Klebsiella pneumoniae]|uniref:AAA family ATPase n=1 Tax=Klebsiella TaxID=570 RepID=UPI002A97D27D|nr:AAA family ATPase [Klebsiella pneumoniae]HEL5240848.1 AAA family ATPase [Klebsiella pneumoniae]HEL7586314.1 AAA family ATPase [Klebsiella pneumoniae]
MSFRLQFFTYNENFLPFIGSDLCVRSSENIFTIIIGKNGSGKSRALSTITNILCSLYVGNKLLKRAHTFPKRFSYGEDFIDCRVINNEVDYLIKLKGRSIFIDEYYNQQIDNCCPKKLIAVSTSPFDKFPEEYEYFPSYKESSSNFYSYYGVGGAPKNRAVKSLIERILFSLIDNPNGGNNHAIMNAMNFLGFQPRFRVSFRLRHSIEKFMKNLNELDEEKFISFTSDSIKKNIKYFSDKREYSYDKLRESFIALNDYYNFKGLSQRNISFDFNFYNDSPMVEDISFLRKIRVLVDLGILSLSDVIIYSDSIDYFDEIIGSESKSAININDISSGQKCLLLSVLSIAASITDDSLVLIDEPEISLHPEWQETYIQLLTKSFNSYKGCHFIIATHSPQVISNLPKTNCFVSDMETESVISSSEQYHKSADFQLATLFNAPGNENEYLKRLAINILTLISVNKFDAEKHSFDLSILKQSKTKLDNDDSVKKLIELIETYEGMVND